MNAAAMSNPRVSRPPAFQQVVGKKAHIGTDGIRRQPGQCLVDGIAGGRCNGEDRGE